MHGADVNARNNEGYTALYYAAERGYKEAILELLSCGADKNIRSKKGETAFDVAKKNCREEAVVQLLGNYVQEDEK